MAGFTNCQDSFSGELFLKVSSATCSLSHFKLCVMAILFFRFDIKGQEADDSEPDEFYLNGKGKEDSEFGDGEGIVNISIVLIFTRLTYGNT